MISDISILARTHKNAGLFRKANANVPSSEFALHELAQTIDANDPPNLDSLDVVIGLIRDHDPRWGYQISLGPEDAMATAKVFVPSPNPKSWARHGEGAALKSKPARALLIAFLDAILDAYVRSQPLTDLETMWINAQLEEHREGARRLAMMFDDNGQGEPDESWSNALPRKDFSAELYEAVILKRRNALAMTA